jgi:hypothetical protein
VARPAQSEKPWFYERIFDYLNKNLLEHGNLMGREGALETSAKMAAQHPYRPGMKMGEMIGRDWQENPMLFAAGPAAMNAAGGAMTALRPPPRSFAPDIPQPAATVSEPAPPAPVVSEMPHRGTPQAFRPPDAALPGGAAAAEEAPATLTSAIVSNAPAVVDRELARSYMRGVRPGGAVENAPGLANKERRIMTVVDQIIENRPNLKLTDPRTGEPLAEGILPRTLRQFSEALDSTKRRIFKQYDEQAQAAGEAGVYIDMAPVAQKLREEALKPSVMVPHPAVSREAEAMAARLEGVQWSPSAAQDLIESINQTIKGTAQNQTKETFSHNSLMANAGAVIRDQLDRAIMESGHPGYQELRNRYGALRSVEKEVATAAKKEAIKNGTLPHNLADLWSGEQILSGIAHLSGERIASGVALQVLRRLHGWIDNPNRAVKLMFDRRQALLNPTAGPDYRAGLAGAPLEMSGQLGADKPTPRRRRDLRPSVSGP